ncbi:MAG TPA: prepilin-type N-terminal cleavage/methylation domain-containing protein [Symbiobacteriaceae bacterium]|nr:prepilin-type N-terminal cleavage/methylation domain-containing protein [Symbiobacteriaceae bacterium]
MRRQSGLSLVELTVALAIIALTTSLAAVSLVSLNGYMKVTSTVALLSDTVAKTRLDAMSRYEYRAVEIPAPQAGTLVVDYVVIRSCNLSQVACNANEASLWPQVAIVRAGEGMGFVSPTADATAPYEIVFTDLGSSTLREMADIGVCHVYRDASGLLQCQGGVSAKTVRIRMVTGIVQVL